LDVDLEDKLLYGLTPMRLAYLVLGLLGALALWSSPWGPSPVRAIASLLVVVGGAVAAWGRWRGRAIDAWIADLSIFAANTRRLAWNDRWVHPIRYRLTRPAAAQSAPGPITVVVAGRTPKAGASTVAIELAACLAASGQPGHRWSVTSTKAPHDVKVGASSFLVSVAAVDAGRVCYLDRGAGPHVAALIPEDESVPQAAALRKATVVAFPDAPASRAFRELAEAVAAAG
jgi:hypothetical protein